MYRRALVSGFVNKNINKNAKEMGKGPNEKVAFLTKKVILLLTKSCHPQELKRSVLLPY